MTYVRNPPWVDNSSAITAARLETIETGIVNASSGIVNVKDYGAVGNDSTDDTTAIQNAITAALAAKVPVYFPAGTYKVTAALDARGDTLGVRGAGMYSSRLKQYTPNTAIMKVGGQFQRFDGFSLEYSAQQVAASTSANCMEFYTSYFSHFSNIYTYGGARHYYIPQVNDQGTGQNGAFSNLYDNLRGLGATIAYIRFDGYVGFYTGSVWSNIYFNNKVGGSIVSCTGPVVQFSNGDEMIINQLNIEDVDTGLSGASDKVVLIGNRATTINGLHFERVKLPQYQSTLMVVSSLAKVKCSSFTAVYCEVTNTASSNRSFFKIYQGRCEVNGVNVHSCLKESGASVYLVDVNDAANRAKAVLTMADYDATASSTSTMGTTGVTWATGSFFTGNAVNDGTSIVTVS